MNINYLAYDPFLDSIEYLHMLQEQQDYQKVAQSIKNKYGVHDEAVDMVFNQLHKLSAHIQLELNVDEHLLQTYFDGDMPLASMMVLNADQIEAENADAYRAQMDANLKLFSQEKADRLELLEMAAQSNAVRWQWLKVYHDPLPYYHELKGLLNETAALIIKHMADIEPLLELYQAHINPQRFYQIGIKYEENSTLNIRPSVFSCNRITIFNDSERNVYDVRDGIAMIWIKLNQQCFNKEEVLLAAKAMADPSKLEILSVLKQGRSYGQKLAGRLNLTTATVSYHMSALINANLITMEKEGTRIYYSINEESVRAYLNGIEELLLK